MRVDVYLYIYIYIYLLSSKRQLIELVNTVLTLKYIIINCKTIIYNTELIIDRILINYDSSISLDTQRENRPNQIDTFLDTRHASSLLYFSYQPLTLTTSLYLSLALLSFLILSLSFSLTLSLSFFLSFSFSFTRQLAHAIAFIRIDKKTESEQQILENKRKK